MRSARHRDCDDVSFVDARATHGVCTTHGVLCPWYRHAVSLVTCGDRVRQRVEELDRHGRAAVSQCVEFERRCRSEAVSIHGDGAAGGADPSVSDSDTQVSLRGATVVQALVKTARPARGAGLLTAFLNHEAGTLCGSAERELVNMSRKCQQLVYVGGRDNCWTVEVTSCDVCNRYDLMVQAISKQLRCVPGLSVWSVGEGAAGAGYSREHQPYATGIGQCVLPPLLAFGCRVRRGSVQLHAVLLCVSPGTFSRSFACFSKQRTGWSPKPLQQ